MFTILVLFVKVTCLHGLYLKVLDRWTKFIQQRILNQRLSIKLRTKFVKLWGHCEPCPVLYHLWQGSSLFAIFDYQPSYIYAIYNLSYLNYIEPVIQFREKILSANNWVNWSPLFYLLHIVYFIICSLTYNDSFEFSASVLIKT